MSRRRILAVALAAAAVGCEPSVPSRTNPSTVDYAVFDVSTSQIPLPNDLALRSDAIAAQSGAQQEFLRGLATAGGFPNDQEVPITIGVERWTIASDGSVTKSAPPPLDIATLTPSTLIVLGKDLGTGAIAPVAVDASYATNPTNANAGQLTLRNKADASGSRRWKPRTQYYVLLRGGDSGVKTTEGGAIQAMSQMYLLTQGKDLSLPENQYLLPGDSREARAATGQQLEQLRQALLPLFGIADQAWGAGASSQIASAQAFTIAPSAGDFVLVDAGSGQVPLPTDLLLDPATGKVSEQPAAFCGGVLDAQGSCATARAIATLDGFSTTAMYLLPTASPILASTVTSGTVLMYEVTSTGLARVRGGSVLELGAAPTASWTYVAQPPQIQASPSGGTCPGATCVSQTIGLQPSVPVVLSAAQVLTLPPFKEKTRYVVVVTNGVKDATGNPLVRNSFTKLLFFQNPLADLTANKSLVSALPDAQAVAIEKLRTQLMPGLIARLAADGVTADQVIMLHTVTTLSITGDAVQLAAAPYSPDLAPLCATLGVSGFDCTKPVPGSTKVYTPSGTLAGGGAAAGTIASVFQKYGVDATLDVSAIGSIIETQIATLNGLDPATGAFNPDKSRWVAESVDVLIAVPSPTNANLQACSGALAALAPGKCLPLAVFHHPVGGSRTQMLPLANSFAGAGIVLAAIDAPKHGARSFCSQLSSYVATSGVSKDAECVPGNFCVVEPSMVNQGDPPAPAPIPSTVATSPGRCRTANDPSAPLGTFANQPTLCINGGCTFPSNAGFPRASGEFFVSNNFFRTRDSIRQELIDGGRLVQVLEPTPAPPPLAGQEVYNALAAQGLFISPSPTTTFAVGQSLGSMTATVNLAANPRLSRGVLNTGGATMVDVVTNAPAFKTQVDALFKSLGIDRSQVATNPAVAAKYLQTLQVAKWILDPAEPANFAGHLASSTLPNLLPPLGGNTNGSVPQAAKAALAQYAVCDQTVPNPFNALLTGQIGLAPITPPAAPGATGTASWFVNPAGPAVPDPTFGCPAGQRVPNGFLTSWGQGLTGTDQAAVQSLTAKAQAGAAAFLLTGAAQPTLVVP